jgi:hypothetical protein
VPPSTFVLVFFQELAEGETDNNRTDVDDDPLVSDTYHRTLIECLPRVWPKDASCSNEHVQSTVDLFIEIIHRSNWQMQLVIIQSIKQILMNTSSVVLSNVVRLLEPIMNLGPRSKASSLKREILLFLTSVLGHARYSACFVDDEHLTSLLQFNIDEMIHDTRSTDISEQAKQLRKQYEPLFVKTKQHIEQVDIERVDRDTNDLF